MNKLFIWIPKTGGTTIFEAIKDKEGMEIYLDIFSNFSNKVYYDFNNKGNVTFSHVDIRFLLKSQIINKEYWENSFKFCFVRNPYDRVVSLWNDFKKSKRINEDTTLNQFIWNLLHKTLRPCEYNVKDYSQCSSQVQWLLPNVNIFKFEKLDKTLNEIFNINKVPYLNKSSNRDYTKEYDNNTLKLVTKLYYDDFCALDYPIISNINYLN